MVVKLPQTRKRKITNLVLLTLEKAIDGYIRFEDFAYHHYRYHYGYPDLKKSSLSKALFRLRKEGFIELIDEGELILRLTDRGKEKALLAKLQESGGEWDGKWRIVIFDVPEKKRSARDLFRHNLKSWGFVPWQQSVWVTKKDCTKPLREYIKKIGMEDWVMVLETDNIGR